jgi:hypothetical protein
VPDIQDLPPADLKPWPRNARIHSRKQVKQLAQSIGRFGFTQPILIDEDNRILAGHGRVRAAQELGLAKVPCLRIAHLSPAEKRAYVLADNKLALNAAWDHKLLAEELTGLIGEDIVLDIGFSVVETERLIADSPAEEDVDREASGITDAPARCRAGDIWRLGPHWLVCNEALGAETVGSLLKGQLVQMLVARPGGASSTAKSNEDGDWSGATFLSAERAGRRVVMSESDSARCDRIIQHWEARTRIPASRFNAESVKEATRVTA